MRLHYFLIRRNSWLSWMAFCRSSMGLNQKTTLEVSINKCLKYVLSHVNEFMRVQLIFNFSVFVIVFVNKYGIQKSSIRHVGFGNKTNLALLKAIDYSIWLFYITVNHFNKSN
jgi:hypothetical protein